MPQDLTLGDRSLAETLDELQQKVRSDPSNAKYRVFLFQLLAVLGQWDRALNQLTVSGELDPGALAMVQTYREAIRCEMLRREVFAGKRSPLVFGEPQPWVAHLLEALRLSGEGKDEASQELRSQAFDAAPGTSGRIVSGDVGDVDKAEGETFEWVADADPRLGPMLEAVINGRYYWVPLANVRRLDVEKPEDLRDLVWAPVHFQWANGGEVVALIPTRYPGTETKEDDALRLARRTEWEEHPGELFIGWGQRMFATDAGEYPLLDIRRIDLDVDPVPEGQGAEADA